jgi:hypothetical protein
MSWFPLGYVTLGSRSREVRVGRFSGELLDGSLHLRVAYRGGGSPDPLSFFIVDFVGDDGVRSIGSEKWWPKAEPAAVRLGPCPASEASGVVTIKARSFNRRRLLEGFPSPAAPVSVEAFLPSGSAYPWFTPSGFSSDGVTLDLVGGPVGGGGAYRLGVRGA